MLSYQHGYHAGNPADVHKHVALVLLLDHLLLKSKPFCFIDCHAGRGIYDLDGEMARKTREADQGIGRLAAAAAPPEPVARYLSLVASFNTDRGPNRYPGSPALAAALMRDGDRGILLELHPQEVAALRGAFGTDSRIGIHARDCYEGLPALLPPAIRRGLVLLDPSYEMKTDYDAVATLLATALARWANGIYLLWYPVLAAGRHRHMLQRIREFAPADTLVSEHSQPSASTGLQGSGLVIVNPPWQFDAKLAAAMHYVTDALDGSGRSTYSLRALTSLQSARSGADRKPRGEVPTRREKNRVK